MPFLPPKLYFPLLLKLPWAKRSHLWVPWNATQMAQGYHGSRIPFEIKSTETIYPVITKPRLLLSSYFLFLLLFFWNSKQIICSSMPPFCWSYNVLKFYLLTLFSSSWLYELMVFLLLWGNRSLSRARNLFEISLELENITKGNQLVLECTIFLGEKEEEMQMVQSNSLFSLLHIR